MALTACANVYLVLLKFRSAMLIAVVYGSPMLFHPWDRLIVVTTVVDAGVPRYSSASPPDGNEAQ